MRALIHRLTHASQLQGTTVVCGALDAAMATWDVARVSCPQCRPAPARHPSGGMREAALQEAIRQACALQGWLYYHTHDSRHSPAGFVDTVAVRGERLLFAELKRVGATPTEAQAQWLDALRQVERVETYLWTLDDLAEALEVLR